MTTPTTPKYPLYQRIARTLGAIRNCRESGNTEWLEKHLDTARAYDEVLPCGSGIDAGCVLDTDKSTPDKIIIHTSYHHMNDGGMYDGWTDHTITVRPSLQFGFEMTISGRDRNGIKEYLAEVFHTALMEME